MTSTIVLKNTLTKIENRTTCTNISNDYLISHLPNLYSVHVAISPVASSCILHSFVISIAHSFNHIHFHQYKQQYSVLIVVYMKFEFKKQQLNMLFHINNHITTDLKVIFIIRTQTTNQSGHQHLVTKALTLSS